MTEKTSLLESAIDEIDRVLLGNKSADVNEIYLNNAKRYIKETLTDHQPTFEVGEYYVSENKQIYKLTADQRNVKGVWRRGLMIDDLIVVSYVTDEELQQDKPATAEEIAEFKRAEHFASKGRKLDEFRVGDTVKDSVGDFYIVYSFSKVFLYDIYKEVIGEKENVTLIQTAEELREVWAEAIKKPTSFRVG